MSEVVSPFRFVQEMTAEWRAMSSPLNPYGEPMRVVLDTQDEATASGVAQAIVDGLNSECECAGGPNLPWLCFQFTGAVWLKSEGHKPHLAFGEAVVRVSRCQRSEFMDFVEGVLAKHPTKCAIGFEHDYQF